MIIAQFIYYNLDLFLICCHETLPKTSTVWRVKLNAMTCVHVYAGLAFKQFYINAAPHSGRCEVFPKNGTALESLFNVHCPEPFIDEHKPFTYEISVAGQNSLEPTTITKWKLFHQGKACLASCCLSSCCLRQYGGRLRAGWRVVCRRDGGSFAGARDGSRLAWLQLCTHCLWLM